MSKKDKAKEIWGNYSIFSKYIKGQVKKEKEKAKEQGKTLSKEEIEKARKKYTKKARIKGTAFISAILATGALSIETYNLGKNITNPPKVNAETEIVSWKEGIKISLAISKERKEKVEEEINDLSTKEEILQYVKQKYVDEYNKNNKQKIKVKDIQIIKSNLGEIKKHDKNGKYIYKSYKNVKNGGVYTISQNGERIEDIARILKNNDYQRAYREGEEKETNTEEIYETIATGIDYCIGYDNYQKGETSQEILSTYKNRLINSIYNKEKKERQLSKNKQTKTNQKIDEEELEQ